MNTHTHTTPHTDGVQPIDEPPPFSGRRSNTLAPVTWTRPGGTPFDTRQIHQSAVLAKEGGRRPVPTPVTCGRHLAGSQPRRLRAASCPRSAGADTRNWPVRRAVPNTWCVTRRPLDYSDRPAGDGTAQHGHAATAVSTPIAISGQTSAAQLGHDRPATEAGGRDLLTSFLYS